MTVAHVASCRCVKGRLHQPTLSHPEVALTGQQPLALQGRNGLEEQPFAVVARVLAQDILHGIGVADEIDRMGQGGQPYDVAKLLAESVIFRQGAPPHPAQAVPERNATRARGTPAGWLRVMAISSWAC